MSYSVTLNWFIAAYAPMQVEYTIRVQMLEIYNETLRDLLSEDQSTSGNRLDILNTQASGLNVPNAVKVRALVGRKGM